MPWLSPPASASRPRQRPQALRIAPAHDCAVLPIVCEKCSLPVFLSPQTAPTRVETLSGARIVAASAAKFHSVALTDAGAVYTWGFGRSGRLGHVDSLIHSGVGAAILPRQVAGLAGVRVVAVAAGKHHTLAATDNGARGKWGTARMSRLPASVPALGYAALF